MGYGITVFTGPEGAGKTSRMTAALIQHWWLGGKVYTFPGYDVSDGKGNFISTTLKIEEWLTMDEEKLANCAIGIDEPRSFFSITGWGSALQRIFVALLSQRRKRGMAILMTSHEYRHLPTAMRDYVHFIVTCWDMHWANAWADKKVERGKVISCACCDVKGFVTGFPGSWSTPYIFRAEPYWRHYNTYAYIDALQQFTKVKVKRPEIELDLTGSMDLKTGIGELDKEEEQLIAAGPITGNPSWVNKSRVEIMEELVKSGKYTAKEISMMLRNIR